MTELLQIKHLLVENELKKLEKFDAAYFRGKNYFDGDGTQNFLVFQPIYKYFTLGSVVDVSSWNQKDYSMKKIVLTQQLITFCIHQHYIIMLD